LGFRHVKNEGPIVDGGGGRGASHKGTFDSYKYAAALQIRGSAYMLGCCAAEHLECCAAEHLECLGMMKNDVNVRRVSWMNRSLSKTSTLKSAAHQSANLIFVCKVGGFPWQSAIGPSSFYPSRPSVRCRNRSKSLATR
jgi:hypothetical protein